MRHEGVGTGATFDAVADLLLASEIPGFGRFGQGVFDICIPAGLHKT